MGAKLKNLKLNTGDEIPIISLGTFKAAKGEVAQAVKDAIEVGYRHFDCAWSYHNEEEMGIGLQAKINDGTVTRENLFITTKLWNNFHDQESVVPILQQQLKKLQLEYVDLYLIHTPMGFKKDVFFWPAGQGADAYSDVDYLDTWKGMEECVKLGLARNIGISNFNSEQIMRLLSSAVIKPAVNQIEANPNINNKKLIKLCKDQGILVVGFSCLGRLYAVGQQDIPEPTIFDKGVIAIAEGHKKTPAQVVLKYLIGLGIGIVVKTVNRKRMIENLNLFDFELHPDEVEYFDSLNKKTPAQVVLKYLTGGDMERPDYDTARTFLAGLGDPFSFSQIAPLIDGFLFIWAKWGDYERIDLIGEVNWFTLVRFFHTPSNGTCFKMYINKGKDDQMEICGYRKSKVKLAMTYFFIVLTFGLLRLLFHWIPHWLLKATCVPCPVTEAEQVLVTELYNGKHKIYHVKPLRVLTPESVRKLKNDDNLLNHHYMPVIENSSSLSVHFGQGIFRDLEKLLLFTCKKVTYVWNSEISEFVKLRGLDQHVTSEVLHKSKGLSFGEQFMRRLVYGPNEIIVKELSVMTLLFLEVLNPFYIFQLFSFCLWFADNYYYYAAAILLMSVFGITMTVIQTRKNQRNLKSTVHSSDVIPVVRSKPKSVLDDHGDNEEIVTEVISTDLLVPGDVIEIPPHGCILHCDAVLLTGNCILNESMLTGESVPVTKTPLPELPDLYYNSKEHARHTLFCGTQVIQTRYFGNEKVLAVVIRTGFCTAKGGLVRSILYPPPVDFRFENDSYRFIMLLGAIAGVGFIYTIVTKIMRGIPAGDLVLEALDLITIVVPPALPAAMTVGRLYAQTRLKKNQIFCISPRTINVSGSIDSICFDKTGTLTEDGLDLLCIVPVDKQRFLDPVKNVESLPYNTFVCGLVSCHSLTIIDKQVTGDPLDLKMFESTKWSIEEHDVSDNTKFNMIYPTVMKPPKNRPVENRIMDDIDLQIGIIREFPFSSSSQRMGVIVRKLGAQNFEYYCKGSPEMVLTFVKNETIPSDFYDTLETYTQEGYRVIAMAHKELKMSYAKVQRAQREVIESELNLLGLIVLENRLKAQTIPCIRMLNEANIRVIMVTGDNILTALSVARDCGIVPSGQSVISINADNSSPPQLYYTLASTKRKTSINGNDYSLLSNSASIQSLDTVESQTITGNMNHNDIDKFKPKSLFNNYRFGLSGKVWGVVRDFYPELIPRLVTRGAVFARMSPDQKQQLVEELQNMGYCVAMCGDGANDCGALKAAHVGISLSEAESSVASPFTSKNADITCVRDIIKEGRAALVTSFGIFKYMASYSLCQFVSVMILYSIDSNLTDIQYLYIDLFIISIFAFFFGKTEAYSGKLVKETPLSSLISVSPVLSLLVHLSLTIGFQVAVLQHLKMQEWFVPFDSSQKEEKDSVACMENYAIYTISSFQYVILAVVFSKGKPYRQSMFSNYGLLFSAAALVIFSIYMALWPASVLSDFFELILPEDFTFRLYLLVYALLNFVISVLIEIFVIDYLFFKKLRFKFHNVYKSKRKYLAIERDLERDSKWPVLTSEFRSAASPLTPMPHCTAEIVIETNKFDKNHVLNCLYDNKVGVHNINVELLKNTSPSHSCSNDSGSLYHSFGIFKYMASYSLCQFVSVMILFSIDSNLTDIQYLYIDLFIISIFAFFFGKTEAYSGKLVKETPLSSLISVSPVLSLLVHLSLTIGFQVAVLQHLKMQEWFVPFDSSQKEEKDSVACMENYAIYTISSFQYVILAVVFSKGKPYRQSMFSNYGLLFSAAALVIFSIYMALWPASVLSDFFELILPEDFTFRLYLLVYALLNFVISVLIEIFVIDYLFFKKLRFKFHNVYKSKRKYLAIERDLERDSKWPVLTSEFRSAASPLTPMPHCTAEIVIETNNL
ncbi:hypothetical protein FQR65_LT14527 [Abscondita terminalis]|nr:hypothetical protein FQR65_LT14527 [Abscondita terminalis]